MKALTLWQPWASLVAAEVKRSETRSWRTNYRGPIAIHAAKFMPAKLDPLWRIAVEDRLHGSLDSLPRGAIVAFARLVEIIPADASPRDPWGDYTSGRWVWRLACIESIEHEPIPTRGHQGLWNWNPEARP